MWSLLYQYAFEAFWPKWWPVVSAFALFGLEPVVKAYWPWGARQLDRLSAQTRRRIEIFILVVAVFYAGFSSWLEEHEALNKVTVDLSSARGERDEARRQRDSNISPIIDRLSGDLVAARAQIDAQAKQIEEQSKQIAVLRAPKPARHLAEDRKASIRNNFMPLANMFTELQISAPAGDGNAHSYAQEFADLFNRIGIHVSRIGMLFATSPASPGPDIFILVKDSNHVPDRAELFAKTLVASGIQVQGGRLDTLGDDNFVLMVGPAP
jgi:hypothetical protein